jgi:hypothetical protein
LAGETEVLGENLPQCRFVHPTCFPDANPSRCGGKPATNRLTYGTAIYIYIYIYRERERERKNNIDIF